MLKLITSRLAGPIASAVVLLLAVALAWVLIGKNATIRALESAINDPRTGYAVRLQLAQADLVQCRSNRLTLEEATRRQNDAIEAAQRAGEARLAALDRAASAARQSEAAAASQAARILRQQGTGNSCADADALILGEAR